MLPLNDPSQGSTTFHPRQRVRTMQVISVALMMGVLIFTGVTLLMRLRPGAEPPAANPVLSYVAVAATIIAVIARSLMMSMTVQGSVKELLKTKRADDLEPIDLFSIYQVRMIVGAAQLEGAAFFVLVSYMTDGQLWSMGLVVALLAMMAATFPTFERVQVWAEDTLRAIRLNPPRPETF